MTFRYVTPAQYECDGCHVKVVGWDNEVPEGWTRVVEGKGTTHWYGHYCPKCPLPEAK